MMNNRHPHQSVVAEAILDSQRIDAPVFSIGQLGDLLLRVPPSCHVELIGLLRELRRAGNSCGGDKTDLGFLLQRTVKVLNVRSRAGELRSLLLFSVETAALPVFVR